MEVVTIPFILLILSIFLIFSLSFYVISKRPLKQLQKSFLSILTCIFIISIGVLLQSIFSTDFGVNPIYFEYFIYVGTCFLPVSFFFTALTFKNTRIKFEKRFLLAFIIPILSLIILWTNDIHNLFYVKYSSDMTQVIYGPYFNIHFIYTCGLLFVGM